MKIVMVFMLSLFFSTYLQAENSNQISGVGKKLNCHQNLDFNVKTLNHSKEVNLCEEYQGNVIVIVNTASKCAFTGQYEGLEEINAKYQSQGVVVLGFPSNDFGNQEPGTEKEIQDFCRLSYGVEFPMFAKTRVTKRSASPLFKQLGEQKGYPKWNFYKYLLDREGNLVESYSSITSPKSKQFISKLESLL